MAPAQAVGRLPDDRGMPVVRGRRGAWWWGLACLLSLLALVLLSRQVCTSGLVPRAEVPPRAPPAGSEFLVGSDGVRLYYSVLGPGTRGVVWLVLGPEVTSAPPYPVLTRALHRAGFATALLHLRGTGYSDGLRGDGDDYAEVLSDLRAFRALLARRFASPVFLLGHSLGGALALELAGSVRASSVAGLVLVNPAYHYLSAPGMTPSLRDYLRYAANLVLRPAALTVDMNGAPRSLAFAPDRAEGVAMQQDALTVRYFSMRYLLAERAVMERCAENASRSSAPLLLIQGAHDALIDPRGNDALLRASASRDKRKLVAPAGGHGASAVETMHEPLLDWLRALTTRD